MIKSKTKPFNWKAFLSRDPKLISTYMWRKVIKLSNEWPTCTCGIQDPKIKRTPFGVPIDMVLMAQGVNFSIKIVNRDLKGAKRTFRLIEKRAAEVIKIQRLDYDHI